ncbi:multidrug ABC transporter substrate-binding protein [Campylobacter troglodytis]|nr:multidrug ABC transporter substrate-binding protein [Campylobacter troglodytis]
MPKEVKSYALFKNQLLESLKIAYSSIVAHKLRSLLTMLGIIIGIASVVSVVALGLGSKQRVLESIARLGTNTIEVHGGRGYGDLRSGRVKLALSDLYTLQNLPYLESVEAQDAQSGTATYGNISLSARMEGGGIHIFDIRGLSLDFGRLFNEEEVQEAMNVAVLDDNGKKRLFADLSKDEIIGKTVLFNKQPFKIIGVLQKDPRKPDSDINVKLYTPYTTLRNKITGSRVVSQIVAKVSNEANPSLAEEAMIRTLEIKRGQRDFFTINSDSIKQSIEENSRTMTILITSIAIIALVVGGIGVMNIMIVSVSERTREIGIRMAIGARKEDILFQFLIEAIMICMIGAILGVGLSFVVVEVFNALSKDFLMIMSGASVLLGLLSSVIIGLVFGFFPAKNAANLNPINALSKE